MIIYGTFVLENGVWKSEEMKAIFTAFFGAMMVYGSVSVTVISDMAWQLFLESLMMLPAILLGSYLGLTLYPFIPDDIFQWIVIVLLAINALILTFT